MGLSIAVTYSNINGFHCYTEEKVNELVSLLKSANLVVGFNHIKFDYEVLTHIPKKTSVPVVTWTFFWKFKRN